MKRLESLAMSRSARIRSPFLPRATAATVASALAFGTGGCAGPNGLEMPWARSQVDESSAIEAALAEKEQELRAMKEQKDETSGT